MIESLHPKLPNRSPRLRSNKSRRFNQRFPSYLLGYAPRLEPSLSVIEGAPGQGKSTITQYVCQVHRMRLLNKANDLQQINEQHRNFGVRLPIKVDLRDFAVWLGKHNPFGADGEELESPYWAKSLESFLAALIHNQSGGAQFDVVDLQAILKLSAVLVVLDGLDEVADIKRRKEVVDEIQRGVDRMKSIAASLQVVVTSRPAAFENSPGLPNKSFNYLHLDSVSQELIEEYATKWVKARRLNDSEGADAKRILREKMTHSHFRDLARNPMQLAILLTLIHTKGVSLPDKRTALYDNYVGLFFDRESEKSPTVKVNRDLLIDIHRYLAWLLHVESERSDGTQHGQPIGAIEESRLKSVLKEYLLSEGQDPDLADSIFTSVIERVVALVSRVQGTFEFEVQPLREYFAARFLHETAPYSPVGSEKPGTRPDRFDAIARNFYWLNVTRFYAGCYSKGELPSLIDRLSELIRDPQFEHLSHPRVLGATLLGDWVFTQHPRSVAEVVKLVLDGLGLRFLLTSASRRLDNTQPLVLPAACGKNELVARCFELLREIPPTDFAYDVIDLLISNATRDELMPRWKSETSDVTGLKRTEWIGYGLRFGCTPALSFKELDDLCTDQPLSSDRINIIFKSRLSEYFERSTDSFKLVVNTILSGHLELSITRRKLTALETFAVAVNPARYGLAYRESNQAPLTEIIKRYSPRGTEAFEVDYAKLPSASETVGIKAVIDVALEVEKLDAKSWVSSLTPWNTLISTLVNSFGEKWIAWQLANVASGIKSTSETCTEYSNLFDVSRSLCRRVRYARLRAGTALWWNRTFEEAETIEQKSICTMLFFTWASPNTISQIATIAQEYLAQLPISTWDLLFDSVEHSLTTMHPNSSEHSFELPEDFVRSTKSQRMLALLRLRSKPHTAKTLYNKWLELEPVSNRRILRVFNRTHWIISFSIRLMSLDT